MRLQPGESRKPIYDLLHAHYSQFEGDPFEESIYWTQMALYYSVVGDAKSALASYRTALHKGYPAANLYNEMGAVLVFMGDYQEAKRSFEEATRAPVDRTNALENLKKLDEIRE